MPALTIFGQLVPQETLADGTAIWTYFRWPFSAVVCQVALDSSVWASLGSPYETIYKVEPGTTLVPQVAADFVSNQAQVLVQATQLWDEANTQRSAYREVLPTGDAFYTSDTWYTDITKTQKIQETTITRNASGQPTLIVTRLYDYAGTLRRTLTDTITYANQVESTRTRVST